MHGRNSNTAKYANWERKGTQNPLFVSSNLTLATNF